MSRDYNPFALSDNAICTRAMNDDGLLCFGEVMWRSEFIRDIPEFDGLRVSLIMAGLFGLPIGEASYDTGNGLCFLIAEEAGVIDVSIVCWVGERSAPILLSALTSFIISLKVN